MLELNYKESWVPKNWSFWTVMLEKTPESPLDCKEIQQVHPKGKESWVFIGRADAEAEAPVLWPHQASLSITNSWSLLKLMSIMSVMPSNHLILCRPFLLLPSIFPSIGVFWMSQLFASVAKVLEYQLFDISPSNEHPGLISFRMAGWISLQSKGLSRVFSDTTVQNHQFFSAQLSL